MTDTDLAALLHEALLDANEPEHNANCAKQPLECPVAMELAEVAEKMLPRLIAQGVRVGDDGLARLIAAVDALLDEGLDGDPIPDDEWAPEFIELREARAALTTREPASVGPTNGSAAGAYQRDDPAPAQPAPPALDRERLARALYYHDPLPSDGPRTIDSATRAAAIADAYEADDA